MGYPTANRGRDLGQYLAHREALLRAEVQGSDVDTSPESVQRGEMGLCKVHHVDVVSHTRAITRRIVSSVHHERGARTASSIDREWNEMRLGIVALAQRSVWMRSCGIEVTKRGPTDTSRMAVRTDRDLGSELARTVGVDRTRGSELDDRSSLWLAVHRSTRRQKKRERTLRHGRRDVNERDRPIQVLLEVEPWLAHRFVDTNSSGEVNDGSDVPARDDLRDQRAIANIAIHTLDRVG